MSMLLTPQEVIDLTGRKRRSSQVTALRTMGIEHKVRPDGVVIISRSHIERLLDGSTKTGLESKDQAQPNWGAM